MRYSFGSKPKIGYTQVSASSSYTAEKGCGIETVQCYEKDDFILGNKPFYFSVKLPEGNYNVKIELGDTKGTSDHDHKSGMQANDVEEWD